MGVIDVNLKDIIEGAGKIADEFHTSKEEERQLDLEEKKLDNELLTGQMEINKVEAASAHWFIAGWRPALGWAGVVGLIYKVFIYQFLMWIWTIAQARGWVGLDIEPPPVLDTAELMTIVMGMLGLGVMRSSDKQSGLDTKSIGSGKKRGFLGGLFKKKNKQ